MRKHIVAGNWKMNKTLPEGILLAKDLQTILSECKPSCKVILAPPYIHLAALASFLDNELIGLSAQDVSDQISGAYTGDVSAKMVASTGAQYTIIGHSERRAYYHEGGKVLAEKVRLALAAGLIPIFCVGELYEDREAGREYEVVGKQLEEALFELSEESFRGIIIAYEPVWAIGTGKTATPEIANEMHKHIRAMLAEKYGQEVANKTSILYGGSCNAANAEELFAMSDIDGGLIGGASLAIDKFLPIIEGFK